MSGSAKMGKIVRVRVEQGETGLFYAESSELRGLLVAEPDMSALWERVPVAIQELYEAVGERVVVTRVEDDVPDAYSFAAIPPHLLAELAQRETSHH